MIRTDAGMSTGRFCALIDVPERTWRRWQAKARTDRPPKGPWPQPARLAVRDAVIAHARARPACGHRKVWAMTRHDGYRVSRATVLRLLRDEGLILEANYQRERRKLAERRKAAFAKEPTDPNQVWQLDFSEYETTTGGGGRGGSRRAGTTGPRTSSTRTCPQRRTCTTRSPPSSSPSRRRRS